MLVCGQNVKVLFVMYPMWCTFWGCYGHMVQFCVLCCTFSVISVTVREGVKISLFFWWVPPIDIVEGVWLVHVSYSRNSRIIILYYPSTLDV